MKGRLLEGVTWPWAPGIHPTPKLLSSSGESGCAAQEDGPHVLAANLIREQRLVEAAKLVLDEDRDVHARGQPHGAVVGCLHPPFPGEGIDEELLRSFGVHRPEADGQHELGRCVGDAQGPEVAEPELGLLLQVHPRHEKAHLLLDVAPEHGGGAGGDPIAVLLQPGLETPALLGGEDEDVVLAHRVAGFYRDAEALLAPLIRALHHRHRGTCYRPSLFHPLAGVRVEVLDQAGGGVGIEVVEKSPIRHLDLLALDEGGDGNDDGKLLEGALIVVGHGHDRLVAVADEGHRGGLVEELRVRLGDVEATKSLGPLSRGSGQQEAEAANREPAHEPLLFLEGPGSGPGPPSRNDTPETGGQ
jgi:hypothetical protein